VEENTLKVTPNEFLEFYRTYGFPIEITTAYELEELKRKRAAEVTEEAFDEFDPLRAHGMGVSLTWLM
jgi:alanyl-tRNA synthetase